jgi:hypothetical protein
VRSGWAASDALSCDLDGISLRSASRIRLSHP